MYFNQVRQWILLLCIVCFPVMTQAQQATLISTEFQVKPNKCVALTQGRECFTKVAIDWALPAVSNVCVSVKYQNKEMVTLACWEKKTSGQLEYEFQSANNATLFLLRQSDGQTLASALVQVSWLYQVNTRKRRWRLF